jgi:hypothetical protein
VIELLSGEWCARPLCDGAKVLADKGFLIADILQAHKQVLFIPPLLQKGTSLTNSELATTKHVAAVRIHVERAICRAKTFKHLSNTNMDEPLKLCFFSQT